jgi:CDP-diacylglycerol pyrophosphatase
MCPYNNCTRFEECQPKGVRGVDYTKYVPFIQNMLENDKVQLDVNFSKNVRTLPKSHMHIFNVSITIVQGLKNVSLKDYTM